MHTFPLGPARHVASGVLGEVQDIMWSDENGDLSVYFEDHARPSRAGWYLDSEIATLVPSDPDDPNLAWPAGLPHLCAACHEACYGYEPDMGDDFAAFMPGTCTNTQNHSEPFVGTVWVVKD